MTASPSSCPPSQKPEKQARSSAIAKRRSPRSARCGLAQQPPMRFAQQQQHFGFFGSFREQHLVTAVASGERAPRWATEVDADLSRQLRNLVGKTVVASQPLVLFLHETAIIDPLWRPAAWALAAAERWRRSRSAVPWSRHRCPDRPAASGRRIGACRALLPISCRRWLLHRPAPADCRRRSERCARGRPERRGLEVPWANAAAGYRIASAQDDLSHVENVRIAVSRTSAPGETRNSRLSEWKSRRPPSFSSTIPERLSNPLI